MRRAAASAPQRQRAAHGRGSGNVTVNYVSLKNIVATGGATFTANNCNDLGNNTGWTINPYIPSSAQNYYWINGTGNWNDGNHWSNTSGGSASGCFPTEVDSVFFDANSFLSSTDSVYLTEDASCKNMDWTGCTTDAVFYSGLYELSIYGSVVLNPHCTFTINKAHFRKPSLKAISKLDFQLLVSNRSTQIYFMMMSFLVLLLRIVQ